MSEPAILGGTRLVEAVIEHNVVGHFIFHPQRIDEGAWRVTLESEHATLAISRPG